MMNTELYARCAWCAEKASAVREVGVLLRDGSWARFIALRDLEGVYVPAQPVPQPYAPGCNWSFEYLHRDGDGVFVLEDLSAQLGGMTVTNQAERVVRRLAAGGLEDYHRIVYRDSEGVYDELVHGRGEFIGFAPIRTRDLAVAVETVHAPMRVMTWDGKVRPLLKGELNAVQMADKIDMERAVWPTADGRVGVVLRVEPARRSASLDTVVAAANMLERAVKAGDGPALRETLRTVSAILKAEADALEKGGKL
jgi:hypothetical protein